MNIFSILAIALAVGYCLFLVIYFIIKAIASSEMAVKRYLEKFKRTTLSPEAIAEMDDEEFEDIMKDLYDLQFEYTEADNPIFDEVFGNLNQYTKLRKMLKAEAEKEAKEIF